MAYATQPRNPIVFEFSYLPFPLNQVNGDEVMGSRIIRVRPIFTSQVAGMGDGTDSDNYYDNLTQLPFNIAVSIESTSRFPGAPSVAEGSYSLSANSWQQVDGWIDCETVVASHHKIKITFTAPRVGDFYRSYGMLKNLLRLEVEYENSANKGSAYIA